MPSPARHPVVRLARLFDPRIVAGDGQLAGLTPPHGSWGTPNPKDPKTRRPARRSRYHRTALSRQARMVRRSTILPRSIDIRA
jgi:hypothetical protein